MSLWQHVIGLSRFASSLKLYLLHTVQFNKLSVLSITVPWTHWNFAVYNGIFIHCQVFVMLFEKFYVKYNFGLSTWFGCPSQNLICLGCHGYRCTMLCILHLHFCFKRSSSCYFVCHLLWKRFLKMDGISFLTLLWLKWYKLADYQTKSYSHASKMAFISNVLLFNLPLFHQLSEFTISHSLLYINVL